MRTARVSQMSLSRFGCDKLHQCGKLRKNQTCKSRREHGPIITVCWDRYAEHLPCNLRNLTPSATTSPLLMSVHELRGSLSPRSSVRTLCIFLPRPRRAMPCTGRRDGDANRTGPPPTKVPFLPVSGQQVSESVCLEKGQTDRQTGLQRSHPFLSTA